jgi:16S rRNA (cytidine1402-2'-O)-methyltransferase
MTKYYEEFIRSEINDLDKLDLKLKGELTIVISEKKFDNKISQSLNESDKRIINQMINKLSIKEIISLINYNNRISKKEIYDYCLKLKNEV